MASGAIDAGLGSPPETIKLEEGGMHPLFGPLPVGKK